MDSGGEDAGEEARVNQEIVLACHQQVSSLQGPPVELSWGAWARDDIYSLELGPAVSSYFTALQMCMGLQDM